MLSTAPPLRCSIWISHVPDRLAAKRRSARSRARKAGSIEWTGGHDEELRGKNVPVLMGPIVTPVCHMALITDPAGNSVYLHDRKDGTAGRFALQERRCLHRQGAEGSGDVAAEANTDGAPSVS